MTLSSPGRPAMFASHSLNSSVAQKSYAAERGSVHLGKPIDLNSSTSSRDRRTGEHITKRAFHIDVVLEGTRKDTVGEATKALLAQLGKPLSYSSFISEATASTSSKGLSASAPGTPTKTSKVGKQDPIKLGKIIKELQETEQGYLKRISYLKTSYADPLRKFAKRKETTIIPLYEANVIFANIENLVTSAEAFCRDLLVVDLSGRVSGHGIGDVCLRHLKELGTFDCYKAYYDRQDESQRALQEMFKRQSFQTFTEGVKYQTSGIGNSGIRELLAEPVQRIPRYLLLWQGMLDSMSVYDPQRIKLEECIVLASRIAACEADDRIKRATVMYCMERTVDAFPANLISNNRDYIDSIDVEDIVVEHDRRGGSLGHSTSPMRPSLSHNATSPGVLQSRASPLHCSLILFDDKLVIVKRASAGISGRKVTGLDNIDRMMKAGGGLSGLALSGTTFTKDKLVFRGVVDILDVIATDVGNNEFELFFEKPPLGQGPRWTGRPFRHYQVVHPPMPVNLEYTPIRIDKKRFVQNIWKAQALARTKLSATTQSSVSTTQSTALPVALVSTENKKLEGSDKLAGQAISFWNVWERDSWIANDRKNKIALHIDETGTAAPLPMEDQNNPLVVLRATPLLDATCRISVTTSESRGDWLENDVVSNKDIDDKVVQTINAFGLYRFRTTNASLPGTPTHSHRLRPSVNHLDSISKNLFGSNTISSRRDSTVGSRKSRSVISRSSTIDTRFSLESKSTAATSLGHESGKQTPSPGRARKSSSPPLTGLQDLMGMSPKRDIFSINERRDANTTTETARVANKSDADLDLRLDLARRNSASVATSGYGGSHSVHSSMNGTTRRYQGPPSPQRGSLTVRNRTPSPMAERVDATVIRSPGSSAHMVRPLDLSRRRTPSPTPNLLTAASVSDRNADVGRSTFDETVDMFSPKSPALGRMRSLRSSTSAAKPSGPRSARPTSSRPVPADGSSYTTLHVASGTGRIVSTGRETIPLREITNDATEISPSMAYKRARSQEDLAPRKRSADYSISASTSNASNNNTAFADSRRNRSISQERDQGVSRHSRRQDSSATNASTVRAVAHGQTTTSNNRRTLASYHASEHAAENTDEHVTVAMRTSRSIRAELMELSFRLGRDVAAKDRLRKIDIFNPSLCRSPPSKRLARRAGADFGEYEPSSYGSVSSRHSVQSSRSELDVSVIDDWTLNVSGLLDQLDHDLEHAKMGSGRIAASMITLKATLEKRSLDVIATQNRLDRETARNDLAKSQITDLQSELEAVYEAFNVELDGMFEDANLPPDEAFVALRRDLQVTKAQRNDIRLENIKLRRQLEDSNLQKEELSKLLHKYGGGDSIQPSA